MKKDIIIRNLERLIACTNQQGGIDRIEPMTTWKWDKLYRIARKYHIEAWVADGIRHYDGEFFLNITPEQRQRFLTSPSEKDSKRLSRFQLDVERRQSLRYRLSRHSLSIYIQDFINHIRNIEE